MAKRYVSGRRPSFHKPTFVAVGVLIGLVLAVLAVFGSHFSFSKSGEQASAKSQAVIGAKTTARTAKKTAGHVGISQSTEPSLRKLAEYEQVYGGEVADRVMVFAGLPATSADASGDATDMATKLKEFAKRKVQPLVIMEPTVHGDSIVLTDFAAGKYDGPLTEYFNNLKAQGITDDMMGVWVHFPEDNIPDWGNTDPKLFQTNVVKAAKAQKAVFPKSSVSILLNAQTFQSNDVNRDYGTFASLNPYVQGLPKDLFNSFGLQGFPWVSAANEAHSALLNPSQFLNANLAIDAARILGVNQVWFNTGTFGRIYANDSKRQVIFSAAQRQAILQGVLTQLNMAQTAGFQVAVNLFSLDGSATGEATDWSYWHTGQTAAQAPSQAVFKSFADQVHQKNMQLWLFDSD
ncbi:MAG TPA: hypothetical protein VLH38_00100 [Patescibacteria group bacterium]|nr:hypothetical protein [Patescibacteria group bacterium]